ncbi:MAG: FecR domain-containing protein [Pseudomonadota bacterium]
MIEAQEQDVIRQAAHDWRTRLSGPDVSPADLEQFQSWISADLRHEAAFDRAQTLFEALGALDADDLGPRLRRRSLWERLPDFFFAADGGQLSPLRLGAAALALVACLGVVALLSQDAGPTAPTLSHATSTHATGVGEIRSVTLDDGSVVTLGAKTELVVTLTPATRRVRMTSGAAYFDVTPDAGRAFVVEAGVLAVTVLGTRFDVRHNGGVSRVGVAEGEVAVRFPQVIAGQPTALRDTARLNAGTRIAATMAEGLRSVEAVAPESVAGWRSKRLVYAGATLAELVADAQRYLPLQISISDQSDALAAARVTAFFDGNDVEGMIETLPAILPVQLVKKPSGAIEILPLR